MHVSTIHLRALTEACALRGIRAEALFEAARQSPELLREDYALVEASQLDALAHAALALSADPAFGLHWGEQASMLQFDLFSLMIASAPSLRTGLQSVLRHQLLLGERRALDLREEGAHAQLIFTPQGASEACQRLFSEVACVGFSLLLRLMGATSAQVPCVAFAYRAPDHAAEYTRLFEGRARFEQAFTGLVFERSLLERPLGVPNPALFRDLEQRAHERCERMRDHSLRARVEAQLRAALPELPGVHDCARALGVSERSLRRHLAREGVSYSELVSRVRLEVARELLREPARPLKEVAAAVGFAEASAFQRAFRRWTGQSPAEFREA